jgi:hypothetical protein
MMLGGCLPSAADPEGGRMSLALDVSLACRVLLGVVFAVSVVTKVWSKAAWQSYRSWLGGLPLRPLRLPGAPMAIEFAECAVVLLVAYPPAAAAGLVVALTVCLALTIGLSVAVRRGASQPCHCFGQSSEPLGRQHVLRNALLAICALTGVLTAGAAGTHVPATAQAGLPVIGGLAAAVIIIFFGDIAALVTSPVSAASAAAPLHETKAS